MIAAEEPLEFSPFGRSHLQRHHPGSSCLAASNSSCRSHNLLDAFHEVSIEDSKKNAEHWDLSCSDGHTIDELYWNGQVVVWSQSSVNGTAMMKKSFTFENQVQQALWVDKFTMLPLNKNSSKEEAEEFSQSLCVLEGINIHILPKGGHIFVTALPFQVDHIWPCNYGLILERKPGSFEEDHLKRIEVEALPLLFNLLHPRDEVTPVLANHSKLSYFTDKSDVVVFSCPVAAILVTYNKKSKTHHIWKSRFAITEEQNMSASFLTCTQTPTSVISSTDSPGNFSHPLLSRSLSRLGQSPVNFTPYKNYSLVKGTPVKPQSSFTSYRTNPMISLSRCVTPLLSSLSRQRSNYSLASSLPSHGYHKTISTPGDDYMISYDANVIDNGVPITPNICLEHLWKDSMCFPEKSHKVFYTKDFSGQQYLCLFLKDAKILRLIRVEENDVLNKRIIFGSVSSLNGLKDTEPVPALNMILAIDDAFTFTLFTGSMKVCKVHIPGSLGMSDLNPSVTRWRSSLLYSNSPRRSSLAPNSTLRHSFHDKYLEELQTLSPVPSQSIPMVEETASFLDEASFENVYYQLRKGLNNSIILESPSGDYHRVILPKMSTSDIVGKCLRALKRVLPRETSSKLLMKWYCSRNAPGPGDLTVQSELIAFLHCLMGLLGMDMELSSLCDGLCEGDWSFSPVANKKLKTSELGNDQDWTSLLSSTSGNAESPELLLMDLNGARQAYSEQASKQRAHFSSTINHLAFLFPHLPVVLFTLHLIYEDCKLNILQWKLLPLMGRMLHCLAGTLNLPLYQDYYWRDNPNALNKDRLAPAPVIGSDCKSIVVPHFVSTTPPSVFAWLKNCFQKKDQAPFPFISGTTNLLRDVIILFSYIMYGSSGSCIALENFLTKVPPYNRKIQSLSSFERFVEDLSSVLSHQNFDKKSQHRGLVLLVSKLGYTVQDLENFPLGISVPLQSIIFHCRLNPPVNWPAQAYSLTRRQELTRITNGSMKQPKNTQIKVLLGKKDNPKDDEDGMESLDQEVLKLRFSRDHRVQEVHRILQSSRPVRIPLQQRPEVSDHEFIEEQEKYLYSLCIRTMALPSGRGMFTLRTYNPVVTETLPIPKLCLTGKAPPRNTTVDLSHIDVPANMNLWPLFHNGVAAALRIAPNASQIHSTWIVYNKPRTLNSSDPPTEHAGFLMGLGLNGHLGNLSTMSVHDYLCKGHDLTSVGLLLGLAASKLGTMDVGATKIMSIHLEALLPPTSTELDVPPMVQVAAILGVGLLYQGSVHRHIAEVLLGEIGRPPGPEMEHSIDRESYALAAGLALGLVTLGHGNEVVAQSDLPMADELYHFMVGGPKRPLTGIHKEKQKSPSYQIREGDCVNVNVTSPGATLALGLMFFNTGNKTVSEWMEVPDTHYLLDMVRPDFLMLRTISHSLIMWNDILPSKSWVESHIPPIVASHALRVGQLSNDVDYETMSQAYCNVISGACMGLGLKFAGSSNQEAFKTLMGFVQKFVALSSQPVAEQAGKSTIETCLNTVVISLAMVMAGSGDLEVLRVCRLLRSRISQASSYVQYGSHMATHLALGLLFLGGGRFTLKTTPEAVGALLCAFFPKFPTHSNDNRYHLQAFRHLYVLAVEPRLLIPKDINSNQAVYAHLKVTFKDCEKYQGYSYVVKAPCLLPELKLLKEVQISDSRYWPVTFDNTDEWKILKSVLSNGGVLNVAQKAGCLPYADDPQGFKSVLSRNIMQDNLHGWNIKPHIATAFTCNPLVYHLCEQFFQTSSISKKEIDLLKQLSSLVLECAALEKTEAIPAYIQLTQFFSSHQKECPLTLWQLNLLKAYNSHTDHIECEQQFLRKDLVIAAANFVEKKTSQDIQDWLVLLNGYLRSGYGHGNHSSVAAFLTFHGIPYVVLNELPGGILNLYSMLHEYRLPFTALKVLMEALSLN